MYFSGDVQKNVVLKISKDSKKNVLNNVFFKQFKLSNLSPIITLEKTDSITMFLVSLSRICKIAMRKLCGKTTSKVACEISAFYNIVENPIS